MPEYVVPFWCLSHKYLKEGAKFLSKLLTAATVVSQSVLEVSYQQCLLILHNSFMFYREFFYIQMEKYARQALSEGVKSDTELHVTEESELYRVINVHYNRNNHIEVSLRNAFSTKYDLLYSFSIFSIYYYNYYFDATRLFSFGKSHKTLKFAAATRNCAYTPQGIARFVTP